LSPGQRDGEWLASEQLLRRFTLAGRHKPSQGEHTREVFKAEFTDREHQVLALLGVSKFALQGESREGQSRHFASSSSAMEEMAIQAIEREGSKGALRGKFKSAGWDGNCLSLGSWHNFAIRFAPGIDLNFPLTSPGRRRRVGEDQTQPALPARQPPEKT
jgi:hypothetical protein